MQAATATIRAMDYERVVWRELLPWVPRQAGGRDPARAHYLQARACDDPAEAVRLLKLAAAAGHAQACFHLALAMHTATGTGFDYHGGLEWYGRAVAQGILAAAYNGEQLQRLELTQLMRDVDADANALVPLAEQGDAVARSLLAGCAREGLHGMRLDPAAALRWYRLAAEQGNARAQHDLASMLENGEGGVTDLPEAARLYEAAAGQGRAEAALRLGLLYRDGRGVPRDDEAAARWVKAAVDGSCAEAEPILDALPAGTLNKARELLAQCEAAKAAGGAGMPPAQAINDAAVEVAILGDNPDHALAFALFQHAADLGWANAQQQVGWHYLRGIGVAQDTQAGLAWLQRSATAGSAYGQEILARVHDEGEFVPRDPELAQAWWRKAAAQGSSEAEVKLGLRESLNPSRFETSIALVPADAQAGGDESEWGERIAEYTLSPGTALLTPGLIGLLGLWLFVDDGGARGFGGFLVAIAILVTWANLRHRVQVYTSALVRRTLFGTTAVELGRGTHYHFRSVRETDGRIHPRERGWLMVDDGERRLQTGMHLHGIEQLVNLLRVAERRDFLHYAAHAYRRGEVLDFGALKLHDGWLQAGRRRLAIAEITAVRAKRRCLLVEGPGTRRFLKVPLVRVPNAWSLLGLLESLAPLGTVFLQPLQPYIRFEEDE